MSVVMTIDEPNGSQEIYEKVASGLTLPIEFWPLHRLATTGVPA